MYNHYTHSYHMGNDTNKIVNSSSEHKNENNILYLVETNKTKFNTTTTGYNKTKEETSILHYAQFFIIMF